MVSVCNCACTCVSSKLNECFCWRKGSGFVFDWNKVRQPLFMMTECMTFKSCRKKAIKSIIKYFSVQIFPSCIGRNVPDILCLFHIMAHIAWPFLCLVLAWIYLQNYLLMLRGYRSCLLRCWNIPALNRLAHKWPIWRGTKFLSRRNGGVTLRAAECIGAVRWYCALMYLATGQSHPRDAPGSMHGASMCKFSGNERWPGFTQHSKMDINFAD